MDNTGSFAASLGGMTPELKAAIQKRMGGSNVPTTAQVSQGAPTANPLTQAPAPATAQAPNMPQPQAEPAQPAAPTLPIESPEAKMIIGSLGNRLKAISKLQGV